MLEQTPYTPVNPTRLPETFVSYFFRSQQKAKNVAEQERIGYVPNKEDRIDFPWPVFKSPLESYSQTFANLLFDIPGTASHSVARWIQNRHKTNPNIHILDFMGSGGFYKDPEAGPFISKELAVTLVDFENDTSGKLSVIANDILKGQTWKGINDFLHEQDIPGFDLILMRPIAGWSTANPISNPSYTEEITLVVLRRLIEQLHPQGGTLLAQGERIISCGLPNIPNLTPGLRFDIDKSHYLWTGRVTRHSNEKVRYSKPLRYSQQDDF